jgi:hypothetical protein
MKLLTHKWEVWTNEPDESDRWFLHSYNTRKEARNTIRLMKQNSKIYKYKLSIILTHYKLI